MSSCPLGFVLDAWRAASFPWCPSHYVYICRLSVKAAARDYHKEINYQEAFKESYLAFAQPSLPEEVQDLLDAPEVGFWVVTFSF